MFNQKEPRTFQFFSCYSFQVTFAKNVRYSVPNYRWRLVYHLDGTTPLENIHERPIVVPRLGRKMTSWNLKPSTKDSRPNMTQLHCIHPTETLKCERSRTPLWFQLALDGIHWMILFQGIHRWIVKLFLQLPYVSTRQADLMKYRSGRKSSCYGLMNWIPEPVWLLFF